MNVIVTSSGTDTDPMCAYCGRPVIGFAEWGAAGPYHPECVRGPGYELLPTAIQFRRKPPTVSGIYWYSEDGPDFEDGCDHEGFEGGCVRMGHTPETCPYLAAKEEMK